MLVLGGGGMIWYSFCFNFLEVEDTNCVSSKWFLQTLPLKENLILFSISKGTQFGTCAYIYMF